HTHPQPRGACDLQRRSARLPSPCARRMTDRFAAFTPPGMPDPVPPYSHVAISGDIVAVSGQMPIAEDGAFMADLPFEEQARQVFRNLEHCLADGCWLFRDR